MTQGALFENIDLYLQITWRKVCPCLYFLQYLYFLKRIKAADSMQENSTLVQTDALMV